MEVVAYDGMEAVAQFGRISGSVWPDLSKNVNFQNPSKKMRLDESFRMVQLACHFVTYIKSYGQKTKVISRLRIWPIFGTATSGSVTPHVAIISYAII